MWGGARSCSSGPRSAVRHHQPCPAPTFHSTLFLFPSQEFSMISLHWNFFGRSSTPLWNFFIAPLLHGGFSRSFTLVWNFQSVLESCLEFSVIHSCVEFPVIPPLWNFQSFIHSVWNFQSFLLLCLEFSVILVWNFQSFLHSCMEFSGPPALCLEISVTPSLVCNFQSFLYLLGIISYSCTPCRAHDQSYSF